METANRELQNKLMDTLTRKTSEESNPLSIINTFFKIRDVFDRNSPGEGTGNPWIDLAQELGPRLIEGAEKITGNLAAMGRGPAAVPNAPAASNAPAGQVPVVQQQPQPTQEEQQMIAEAQVVQQLAPYVIEALKQNRSGQQLAADLISTVPGGENMYRNLIANGPDGLIRMFQNPRAGQWAALIQFGGKLDQFASQFCDVEGVKAILQQAKPPEPRPEAKPGTGRVIIDQNGNPVRVVDTSAQQA
jgi:hypothetical protein